MSSSYLYSNKFESKDCVSYLSVCLWLLLWRFLHQIPWNEQTLRKLVWPCLWPRQTKAHQKWDRLAGVVLEGGREIIQLKVSPQKKKNKNDVEGENVWSFRWEQEALFCASDGNAYCCRGKRMLLRKSLWQLCFNEPLIAANICRKPNLRCASNRLKKRCVMKKCSTLKPQ